MESDGDTKGTKKKSALVREVDWALFVYLWDKRCPWEEVDTVNT
jgi:hypothetical protein